MTRESYALLDTLPNASTNGDMLVDFLPSTARIFIVLDWALFKGLDLSTTLIGSKTHPSNLRAGDFELIGTPCVDRP